jgi:hypothetical protein
MEDYHQRAEAYVRSEEEATVHTLVARPPPPARGGLRRHRGPDRTTMHGDTADPSISTRAVYRSRECAPGCDAS